MTHSIVVHAGPNWRVSSKARLATGVRIDITLVINAPSRELAKAKLRALPSVVLEVTEALAARTEVVELEIDYRTVRPYVQRPHFEVVP